MVRLLYLLKYCTWKFKEPVFAIAWCSILGGS